jgi:hypothetical protein
MGEGLTMPQDHILDLIAEREGGVWVRGLEDGTAEAVSRTGGGLRRFVVDPDGVEHFVEFVPAAAGYRRAQHVVFGAWLIAAIGVAYLIRRHILGESIQLWWLWPVSCAVIAAFLSDSYLEIGRRRTPPGSWDFRGPASVRLPDWYHDPHDAAAHPPGHGGADE